MKYETVLWDFNGTLLDDVGAGVRAVNDMLRTRGLAELPSLDEYYAKFGFPIQDYYRRLGFDCEGDAFDSLAREWVENYNRYSRFSSLRPGILQVLEEFRRRGKKQIILSASENAMLSRQVECLGIRGFFDELIGCDTIYGEGKDAAARTLAARLSGTRLMVGDTLHDYEVSKIVGADCVLLEGGHHSAAILRQSGAVVLPDSAALLDFVDSREAGA